MFAKAIDRPPRLATVSSLTPYLIAVAATAAAAALTGALWPANKSVILALYYPAVCVSAFYGNRRAATLAIVLSAVSTYYLFLSPLRGGLPATEQASVLTIFCIVSSLIVLLIERVKTNEIKLRESEELFRTAFPSNPLGMAISRVSDGRYVEMNDRFGMLIGRSRQQTIGSSASDLTERKQAQDDLHRVEMQFRHIMDVLPVGAYTCDAEGRITYFNKYAARLWGREPRLHDMTERFCGSVRLLAADDTPVPHEHCWMARALATGQSYSGEEITIERPDATRVTVLAHVHPLPDVSGGQPGAINVLVDITDRKRDQEALREQAALLDNAQRIGRMGSWSLDLRTGRLAWPDATCGLFGIARSEFTGTFEQFHSFILAEDVPDYDAANARLSPSEPLFEVEYRIRRPDGAVRWMYSRGHLEVDPSGAPVGRIGIVMDMTDQHVARERLAETVALLRIAGRVARMGGWTIQLPSRLLTWSDETCAIHDLPPGYTPSLDEGIGYYPAEYRAIVLQHVETCARDGTPYDFEVPKLTATGRRIWVRSIAEAVRDAGGRIVRLQGAFQDISARRKADDALQESEAEFRTLAESMPQMVWMTRPDGWNTYFNQRWVDYTGLSLEESYGDGWNTPFHPDDRQRAWDAWQQAIAGGDYNVECRLRRADGRYRWMLVRGLPLRDRAGSIVKWIGTCTDIDDLKHAHEASQRSEGVQRALAAELEIERARLLAAQAVASIGSWDTDLTTLAAIWSTQTHRIFETSPEHFQPTHAGFLRLVHPDDRARVDEAFVRSLDQCSSSTIEHRLLMADGRIKFVEERWQVARNGQGQPGRAIGTCQDISERRQLEQQYLRAQRVESIGALAGGIAHDLNNVLAPILLSIGLLNHDEHDAERLETLATIEASAKRGAAMVGRVLSFARGAEGRREQLQVPPLIRDLATIVRDTFPKNITFEDRLSPDLWSLQADATQLHQVLLNLCVNARDAMPAGGKITLTAKNIVIDETRATLNVDARSGPYVTIGVEDTGSGIPTEIIDKIFDPFFTTKEIGKGTGLGLATSMAIVTGHRGFIHVDSVPGTGTRFEVYLPAQTTPANRLTPLPAVIHPRGKGETVLVVDDESAIRQVARRTLEAFGYRVLLAGDGAEAIALYAHQQADIAVVLTDMMMPLMDGTATIQALVRLNPQVRIIAASGLATGAKAAGAAAARVMSFLHKPYTAETLLSAVKAALA